jgi:molybdopterin/thiamine biosynthesis adenylyltransferase
LDRLEFSKFPRLLPDDIAETQAVTRYSRQAQISGWKQGDLAAASVIVVGIGALGNEVARLLAMSGAGKILLCDPDVVEESNLPRTVLFTERDIGRPKAEAAADALKRLVPGVEVITRPAEHVHGVGMGEIRDATLVVSCVDSRAARVELSGRCGLVGAPLLDGGTNEWGGEVRSFFDVEGPCYACSLGESGRAVTDDPWPCKVDVRPSVQGGHASTSAIVGGWMAVTAVRRMMGLPQPGGIVLLDPAQGIIRSIQTKRDPSCPLHERLTVAGKLCLSRSSPVSALRNMVYPGEPLLWRSIPSTTLCLSCGHRESVWSNLERKHCFVCGAITELAYSVELDGVPGELTLEELRIPPREILPVRFEAGIKYYELI